MFLPLQRGKGTLILQDFKKRVQKGDCFKVAIIPRCTPPPPQPLPGNSQGFLKNGLPAPGAVSSPSRLAFSFRATVHTNELDKVLLGRDSQPRLVSFQPWTPKLFPLPTALLKLFIPGPRPSSSRPREEAASPKGVLSISSSTTRARAPSLEPPALRKVNSSLRHACVGVVSQPGLCR